jgi:hypothetical protein
MQTYSPLLNDQMLQRIRGEFMEMPGLQLTRAQAQRLWGLDVGECGLLLEFLVETGFLCRRGRDSYARLTEGRVERPVVRMAKAEMELVLSHEKNRHSA